MQNDKSGNVILVFGICILICFVGWVMNFQNLFQYWPDTGGIMNAPLPWVLSLIGIFVAPLGTIMGIFY